MTCGGGLGRTQQLPSAGAATGSAAGTRHAVATVMATEAGASHSRRRVTKRVSGPLRRAVLGIALAIAACQVEGRDTTPSSSRSLAEAIQAVHQRMHLRFTAAERIELAIAHSDLDRAHAEAHVLGAVEEPDAQPAWRPYFESIRDAARQIEVAGGTVGAAQLAATLGRRCARCHEALAAHVTLPAEAAPPSDPRLALRMLGHQWAAAQMWQGLIAPSDAGWLAGARALTEAPLNIVAQRATPTSELEVDDVARVRLYARRALTTGSQDTRAELFGALLATCAHCHAVLRDR